MRSDTAKVDKLGQMELATKGNGNLIKLMVKVRFGTFTVTSMKVSGLMIKRRVMEFTFTQMELSIRDNGKTTCKTDGVLRSGQTEAGLRAITEQVASMVKAVTYGLMEVDTLATGLKTKLVERASTSG